MMKMVEVSDEGLPALLGQRVILFCANYFYTGKLEGVNKTCVKIVDPAIVYETGPWSDAKWMDEQKLCMPELYVRLVMIESFAPSK